MAIKGRDGSTFSFSIISSSSKRFTMSKANIFSSEALDLIYANEESSDLFLLLPKILMW